MHSPNARGTFRFPTSVVLTSLVPYRFAVSLKRAQFFPDGDIKSDSLGVGQFGSMVPAGSTNPLVGVVPEPFEIDPGQAG